MPTIRPLDRSKLRRWTLAWALAGSCCGIHPGLTLGFGGGSAANPARNGLTPMASSSNSTALLIDYYDALLRDGNLDGFERNVSARYNEATLGKLLSSTDNQARRASVLSLGLVGGFAASNATVAGALKDKDSVVRTLALDALWAIWFRADTPEHNEDLAKIRKLIDSGKFAEATKRADELIAEAPTFAEAYNQRAIAHFVRGDHAASATDCRQVLKLNPYHVGALGGLGQCLLHLNKTSEAVAVFRRSAEIQPFDQGLKDVIASLEADR